MRNRTIFNLPLVIGLTAICFALIETTLFAGLLYGNYIGADLSRLLQINFYIIFFILFGILMILIIKFVLNGLRLENTIYEKEFNTNWRK